MNPTVAMKIIVHHWPNYYVSGIWGESGNEGLKLLFVVDRDSDHDSVIERAQMLARILLMDFVDHTKEVRSNAQLNKVQS